MSKDRAKRRAEREAAALQRESRLTAARERETARRDKRQRWSAVWRTVRLWQRGQTSTRVKERRAFVGSALLVIIVSTYIITRSISLTIGVSLVAAIATPALAAAFFDRSTK